MTAVTVELDNGVLRVPKGFALPPKAHLAVLLVSGTAEVADEVDGSAPAKLAEVGGAFDFLREEPELYSTEDVRPERRNPRLESSWP